MKNIICFFLFVFLIQLLTTPLSAQSGYDIRVKINGYSADSLWFGRTYGKRAVPDVGAAKGADGWFHFQSDEPTEPGLYAIVSKNGRSLQFMSCWLAEGQRQFSIETDLYNMDAPGDWFMVNDPQRRSRFSTLFNVRSYPRLILLDAQKRVLFKQTGSMPEEVLAREMSRIVK